MKELVAVATRKSTNKHVRISVSRFLGPSQGSYEALRVRKFEFTLSKLGIN